MKAVRLLVFAGALAAVSRAAEPVVVQAASQILTELKGAAPELRVQEADKIAAALGDYKRSTLSPSPGQMLSKEDEIERLRALEPKRIPFKQSLLSVAIKTLCEEAGMSYLAPPDSEFAERITTNIMMNPYEELQVLGENFGFAMDYEKGVWRFYKVNFNELVTKAYTLRYNNLEQVSISSPTINSQLSSQGTAGFSGGQSAVQPMSSGTGGKGAFTIEGTKLIENIKKILAVPTTGLTTPTFDPSVAPGRAAAMKPSEAPKVEPIWNPDTSQLFVVATRQQHSLIAAYLKTVDQPQELIKVSAKFIETTRDPQRMLGVDWSRTLLAEGGAISLSGTGANGAAAAAGAALSTSVDLNRVRSSTRLPQAILSAPAFQLTLQAFASDRMSSVVQDPTLVTTNNREVTFKATTQQPVQQASTNIGQGVTATTAQIAYIEVGPSIAIFPHILPGAAPGMEEIQLNISIVISTILGEKVIGGNPYPVISPRTYEFQVVVKNGETLAIAGLEERTRETTDKKVPVFGDIPVLGYAFKSRSENMVRTTLLAFLTPEIIRSEAPEGPSDALRLPESRRRLFEGNRNETIEQIRQSLAGLPQEIGNLERRANPVNRDLVLNRLERISVELALMEIRLGELKVAEGQTAENELTQVATGRQLVDAAKGSVKKMAGQS